MTHFKNVSFSNPGFKLLTNLFFYIHQYYASQFAQTGKHEHTLSRFLKPWIRASGCRRIMTFPTVSLPVGVTEFAKCNFSHKVIFFFWKGLWFSCSSWACQNIVQYQVHKIVRLSGSTTMYSILSLLQINLLAFSRALFSNWNVKSPGGVFVKLLCPKLWCFTTVYTWPCRP